jgi:hypothetical protein
MEEDLQINRGMKLRQAVVTNTYSWKEFMTPYTDEMFFNCVFEDCMAEITVTTSMMNLFHMLPAISFSIV